MMKQKSRKLALAAIPVFFIALVLSACSLAEDITPPPNYRPPLEETQQVNAVSGPLYPLVKPNLENGAAIFAEKCAPCHGETGLGDGPQAASLPNPPAAIGTSEVARLSSPARWYRMVSEGNLERYMPPFNSLTVTQRWDVVAYAYSLSTKAEALAEGQALYEENCVECHGKSGAGDGAQAASLSTKPASLNDPEYLASKSSHDFYQVISTGSGEMPAFDTKLSEDQRWLVSDYLRSQTFVAVKSQTAAQDSTPAATSPVTGTGTAEPAATQPVTGTVSETGTGIVRGQITNASGGELDPEMTVTLHGFDSMQTSFTYSTTVQTDGTFAFDNIEITPERMFLATTEFQGQTYSSEIITATGEEQEVNLPISVYGTTTDTSMLAIDRLHLFFEPNEDGTLQVIELFIVSNYGRETVVAEEPGGPVLSYVLPEGASNLEFQEGTIGDRYVLTDNGFADTAPVQPGQSAYQVLLAFDLPYTGKLDLVQPISLPTSAVVVLTPQGAFTVEGEGVEDAGARTVEQGVTYQMYNINSINAGGSLQMSISKPSQSITSMISSGDSSNLIIGLAAFGVALIVAGVFLFARSRSRKDEEEPEETAASEPVQSDDLETDRETLMDAILALDDQYQAGELPEEAYRVRRAELKSRLQGLTS